MANKSLMVVVGALLVGSIASALHYMESRTPAERPADASVFGVEVGVEVEVPPALKTVREPRAEDLGRAVRFRIESASMPQALAAVRQIDPSIRCSAPAPSPAFRYSRRVRGMKPFLRPTPGS